MIIKSYKVDETELLMLKVDTGKYSVARMVKGTEPYQKVYNSYEDAEEVYDYLMDQILGVGND